nr:hypothetical protein [Tanacetum cinerariifolium]
MQCCLGYTPSELQDYSSICFGAPVRANMGNGLVTDAAVTSSGTDMVTRDMSLLVMLFFNMLKETRPLRMNVNGVVPLAQRCVRGSKEAQSKSVNYTKSSVKEAQARDIHGLPRWQSV